MVSILALWMPILVSTVVVFLASWVIHMSMLIFFSFIVGIIFREWRKVTRLTYATLIIALLVLLSSFVIMTWGSVRAEKSATAKVESIQNPAPENAMKPEANTCSHTMSGV